MTVEHIVVIVCDVEGCTAAYPGARTVTASRAEAREDGWTCGQFPDEDLCPNHALAVIE